jgi:hypothetical protein
LKKLVFILKPAQPGAAADVAFGWCLRWYVLWRRLKYTEPNPAQLSTRLSAKALGLIVLFDQQGGIMRLTKYRYVTIKSEKVFPQYTNKKEAILAIKELKLIKKEVRLEKRKLQNRKNN